MAVNKIFKRLMTLLKYDYVPVGALWANFVVSQLHTLKIKWDIIHGCTKLILIDCRSPSFVD